MIMARSRNKTLSLVTDDVGLKLALTLRRPQAEKIYTPLFSEATLTRCPLGFIVADDDFDRSTSTRRINKFAAIGDISAVDAPAYEQTSISARSYCEGQKEAEAHAAEVAQAEKNRKRLLLRTYFQAAEERQAIAYQKTGTIDYPWDGPAAKANLKTGPDVKADYYRQAFAWVDPDANPDTKGAYKFIHHDVTGGGAIGPANIKGCQTGIAVLNGSMGGSKIPDGDKQGVWEHLAAHLRDAKVEPDELRGKLGGPDKTGPAGFDCPCLDCSEDECDNCQECVECLESENCEEFDSEDEDKDSDLRKKRLLIKTYL